MTTELDYRALQALINQQQWWFQPAELHGILSAFVALNARAERGKLLPCDDDAFAATTFQRLSDNIETGLSAADLSWRLLLPEEDPLPVRAEALVTWVNGFLATTDTITARPLSTDSQAFLADLREIARLNTDLRDSEENQQQLYDLEEHCRLGVLMLYADTH